MISSTINLTFSGRLDIEMSNLGTLMLGTKLSSGPARALSMSGSLEHSSPVPDSKITATFGGGGVIAYKKDLFTRVIIILLTIFF